MVNLEGKVAIVTGGARDIGRQVSIRLARQGASVCLNYFDNPEDADETLRLISEFGGKAIKVQGDMTKPEDINRLVETCVKEYGPQIDILVNVVGGLVGRKTINEMDEAFWDFVVTLNMKTVFMVTKAVVPYMKSGASIVNFASQAARDGGGPGAGAYAAAKGGVLTYTRSLAKEFGPKGIRVNAVSPGMISTTFHDKFTKPEVRQMVANNTPLRREGKAEEVADLVAYLASDSASFITGACVEINGGTYFV
ncbi:short-chain dehydrogenase/reductase SDR [Melioribacter roseus P3M-2]|uniref:Short-chain dehydrogenase/reductase SDR n=1 Tax=Melioribacter roseus (strain DSM 23840 / JCM 17771 / VKM B-2668 / P3M-2) TaxID=1191523 RepID=I6YVL2_MELRP|nr:glucose 1-dehydrogenase [Melioribacter roseus]AFN74602.1 short-chain dehydrogenase/reductase SDR [Melioribacter roseus P3M-2]